MQKPKQATAAQPAQKLNAIEILQQRFVEKLTTTLFPVERLSAGWKSAAVDALMLASPAYLQIDAKVFKALWSKCKRKKCSLEHDIEGLTLNEFATLSNNLEGRSCDALSLEMDDYLEIMDEAADHVVFFNNTIAELKKDVEAEVAAENFAVKGNLSAVKAEA